MTAFADWIDRTPIIVVGLLLLAVMTASATIGFVVRKRRDATTDSDGGSEGYSISAVLGLLALLLGFTFSLTVNRFEARRAFVLQEANAIGTSYLRAQALAEPHRSRMSKILVDYTNNRIELATTPRADLLATNDRLLTDLWSATLAANDTVKSSPFSISLLTTVNEVIDLDASRKAARRVRVPAEVFFVLGVYIVMTAGIFGYARPARAGRALGAILFLLFTLAFMLILDIDRPAAGGVTEGQGPMIELRETLRKQPPGTFDRWREAVQAASEAKPIR